MRQEVSTTTHPIAAQHPHGPKLTGPAHRPQIVQHIATLQTETGSRIRSPARYSSPRMPLNSQPLQRSRSETHKAQCHASEPFQAHPGVL